MASFFLFPSTGFDVVVVVENTTCLAITPLIGNCQTYLEPTVIPVKVLLSILVGPESYVISVHRNMHVLVILACCKWECIQVHVGLVAQTFLNHCL